MAFKLEPILFLFFLFTIVSGDCEAAKGGPDYPPQIPKPDVNYKDITMVKGLCARLYIPKTATNPDQKLPLVVYYHGGAFVMLSAFLPPHDDFVYSLVKNSSTIALSVEYGLATNNHPLSLPFNDSWTALEWVASHSSGQGPEEWINKKVDFSRVFLLGDSAGATLAHNMAMKAGSKKLKGLNINGIVLIHPYFWGSKPIGHEPKEADKRAEGDATWNNAGGASLGLDNPLVNPLVDPKLASLGCSKVLVFIAGEDIYRDRGFYYCEALRTNGWKGKVELVETPGEKHVFHLTEPNSKNTQDMLRRISSFLSNA
ncbi:hypothetical protein U1Q18_013922 [Sarracenia purpurea var. burkii]